MRTKSFTYGFLISDDGKNFPQTGFWSHTVQAVFSLQHPHASTLGATRPANVSTGALALVLVPEESAPWAGGVCVKLFLHPDS